MRTRPLCNIAISACIASALSAIVGCDESRPNDPPAVPEIESTLRALTADGARVLGFESTGDWSVVQGTASSFGPSTDKTEGASSISVGARGYVVIRSHAIGALGADAGGVAYLDLKLPAQQSNPWWYGATQVYVEIPSQGLYNAFVGQVELTGLPLNQWQTVSFKIPDEILPKLRAQYSDLVLSVVLNVPNEAAGDYLVDNLRFGLQCPSGYVGPGERCPDPTVSSVPGPFGDFHCLLEGAGSANQLVIRNGTSTETLLLRGTMDFTMAPPAATLDNAVLLGMGTSLSAQGALPAVRSTSATSAGSLDNTTGAIQVTLPLSLYRGDAKQELSLSLQGTFSDHILKGRATAAPLAGGTTPSAEIEIFCREQFLDSTVALHWKLDAAGSATLASARIQPGTPGVPVVRQAQGPTDLLVEARSGTGNIVDQFVVSRPLRQLDTGASSATSDASDLYVSMAYSNRVQTVVLRDVSGTALSWVDLSDQITAFCADAGAQQCDYRAGTTIRQVTYAPSTPAPPVVLAAPAKSVAKPIVPLPSSPRVTGAEFTVTENTLDTLERQPSVAVDAEGNSVVVWRRVVYPVGKTHYEEIRAKGISKDGAVQFDTRVNDQTCVPGPVAGGDATHGVVEGASQWTTRPVVTRSADGAFLVGWGTVAYWCDDPDHDCENDDKKEDDYWVMAPFLCARMFNADGRATTERPWPLVGFEQGVIPNAQYFDLAMDDAHNFVLTWHGYAPGGQYYRVNARAYDGTGSPNTDAIVVSNDANRDQMSPTIAMAADGRAVIAWLSAGPPPNLPPNETPPDPSQPPSDVQLRSGAVKMRRFNAKLAPVGSAQILESRGTPSGVPDVALSRTGGNVVIAWRETDGNIWASTYAFDTGMRAAGPFQANARLGGYQRSPVVNISETGDEFSIFWRDDVTVDKKFVSVVAGQVFRRDTSVLDIDFTVSTGSTIDTENSADDIGGFFSLSSATSTGSTVVWQTTNGISLQRVAGGATSCPAPDTCPSISPLRVTGAMKDKFGLLLHPGVLEAHDGSIIPSYEDFKSSVDFSQAVAKIIVNSLWQNDVVRANANKFNIFYSMEPGLRLNDDPTTFHAPDMKMNFKNSPRGHRAAAVVVPSSSGVPNPPGNTSGQAFVTTFAGDFSLASGRYATFAHEFSHAAWYVSDEYDCTLGSARTDYREQPSPIPANLYTSSASCAARSAHPADCHLLSTCAQTGNTYYVADGRDLMGGSSTGSLQYGLDCQRAAQYYLEKLK
jgi:hypothetical protein